MCQSNRTYGKKNKPIFLKKEERVRPPQREPHSFQKVRINYVEKEIRKRGVSE
jgi:hypothetical protein